MSTSTAEPSAASRSVQAVIVRCRVDERNLPRWSTITIPADHPVFWEPVPPLAERLNIPIAIHREGTKSANRADLDNQALTWLNIDLESGFAPPAWQSRIGTVIVARKDRKPFPTHHFEGLFEYASMILDIFGDGNGPPSRLYNQQAFERWWKNYVEQRKETQASYASCEPVQNPRAEDNWTAVKSPYEV